MAISEKSRSALYQAFKSDSGGGAVGEMLSYFPARDVEEPVTKEFLRAELSDLRMALSAEVHSSVNRLLFWLMGTIIAAAGLAVTVTAALVR